MADSPLRNLTSGLLKRKSHAAGRSHPALTLGGHRPVKQSKLVQRIRTIQQAAPTIHFQSKSSSCQPCEADQPKAWPYDTALPSGLPPIDEHAPAQTRPDNTRATHWRQSILSSANGRTDQSIGRHMDVFG